MNCSPQCEAPRGRMDKLSVADKAASSKVSSLTLNRWVDPSFTDLPGESFAPSRRRKGSQVLCPKAEPKRPRKRTKDAGSSEPYTSYLLKEPAQRDQDESWVDRYSPRSQADLAVHKKKIEEVENWMRVHSNASKGGILLLTGPSGCGKTATVQVLSRELGLRAQEWTNPSNPEPYSSSQHEWRTNGFPCSSQLTQFQDFLLRANKYNCLKMLGDGGTTDRKLILVEDFPNQFYRQPGSLHDILRRFVKTGRCPLVFIVSDSLSGDSSSRFLFPREIQEELDISSISFNPVAPTTMMKVLTRVSTLEAGKSCGRMCVPDQAVLETLCSGSSGDIRSAINSLQFSSLPDSSLEKGLGRMKDRQTLLGKAVSRTNQRKKKSRLTKEKDEEQAIGGKDASLFLFRALGKILHCKRGKHEGAEAAECDTGPGLPSHLSHHHREALLVDPELVVERSHMSGEFFNLYLHQNYVDFFSQLEDVDRASEYLSDADLLTSDWTSRSTMVHYGSSVATRGLLHSNSQQVSVGFRPLHKPNWLLVNKKHRENCLAAQSLFRSFCLTPVSLQTELLPYLAQLTNPMRNQAQIAFIQDVGQMPLRRFPGRLKLEALTDKDPAQLERDSEEEEEGPAGVAEGPGGVEEGLPASQPQPTTSHGLLEEEDLLIEDYASD
ncbi:cell cycle checkpoint protein RAD17 isoform X2 [Perca fluviatilis]|uniref:cell cycle checkpoint protein RAD17 isoform X2 n=1 Tax=Perca fluviatilis TaxID=8168 RepID=UPI001964FE75|nr:cell cycle checkpoint protein RAD17 isoform X2 [Perca fluviatilis]